MASKQVHLNWDPEEQFTLKDADGYQIILNKPLGVSPSDLLPMSLIGCTSYDVVEILKKQRQELYQLKVTAEAVQEEDPPWKFRKIHIRYQVVGRNVDPEKVRKAIEISEGKYCSVYATLRDVIEITHDVDVVDG